MRLTHTRPDAACGRRGFTMMEILFAVLIIGLLMGLLIVGVRRGLQGVRRTADTQLVKSIAMAASQFQKDFGFRMPMPKNAAGGTAVEVIAGPPKRVSVYDIGTLNPDYNFLQANGFVPNPLNPLQDDRYSDFAIAIYLAGALEEPYSGSATVPLDGVKGPGFYPPKRDGTFSVPVELVSNSSSRSLRGTPVEPLINLGGGSLRLLMTDTADPRTMTVADRNGVPIRYYRWEPMYPPSTPADILGDLRVPAMVGRIGTGFPMLTPEARDLEKNPELRTAKFAIVAAGRNGVFGDEPINEIRERMSLSAGMDEIAARILAEEDNIVEVGQ